SWRFPARVPRAFSAFLLAFTLVACLPTAIKTSQPYLLVRHEGETLAVLSEKDPACLAFRAQVLSDPSIERLIGLFDGATKALIASDISTGRSQTVANALVIVVDSEETGVQRKVTISKDSARVPVELALALGREGRMDADWARHHFAWAEGLFLYELMGQRPASSWPPARPYEVTSPARALEEGWAGALDLLQGEANPAPLAALRGSPNLSPPLQDRLLRAEWAPKNGFRVRFREGQPTETLHSPDEALATPGVVTTFFYRLLKEASSLYPQRYMLWFANIEPGDVPYGKVLLAFCRMPKHNPSLKAFVKTYG
ncbi:MAG: hypothetical protein H5T70_08005, partial [Chloroflexi bacterium]|nr:hypothetical protein [Chloroflexota bacterium]